MTFISLFKKISSPAAAFVLFAAAAAPCSPPDSAGWVLDDEKDVLDFILRPGAE